MIGVSSPGFSGVIGFPGSTGLPGLLGSFGSGKYGL